MVIDDFFSQEGLEELRHFLLESTMWTDVKRGGNLGHLMRFNEHILKQLEYESEPIIELDLGTTK